MNQNFHKESGKAAIAVLVVLVIAAVGALAFLGAQMINKQNGGQEAQQTAAQQPAAGQQNPQTANAEEFPPVIVEPGNPVVATVNGEEITRVDVFNFMQQLPVNMKQLPIQQIFPLSQEQVINARLIESKTENVSLDNDPLVQEQLEAAKEQIVRNVYIQRQVEQRITEERLQEAYQEYQTNFPEIQEVRARHILVEDEAKAKELINQLNEGADFSALAQENSTDATAQNGGDLGYFAEGDVVPEFAEAAFKLKPGEYTKKPVKTQFGFHVIKAEEKRQRPPADYETAKPFLETQLRRVALDEVIQDWREEANIQRFDINGKPIEPSAGDEVVPTAPNGEQPEAAEASPVTEEQAQ